MSPLLEVAQISTIPSSEFIAALGGCYEKSPWVAERAHAAAPFASLAALASALREAVDGATDAERLALLRSHPDLAGKAALAGELTSESTAEQCHAGLSSLSADELARFTKLNEAYTARFGFPFILAVRNANKATIFAAFERRVTNSASSDRGPLQRSPTLQRSFSQRPPARPPVPRRQRWSWQRRWHRCTRSHGCGSTSSCGRTRPASSPATSLSRGSAAPRETRSSRMVVWPGPRYGARLSRRRHADRAQAAGRVVQRRARNTTRTRVRKTCGAQTQSHMPRQSDREAVGDGAWQRPSQGQPGRYPSARPPAGGGDSWAEVGSFLTNEDGRIVGALSASSWAKAAGTARRHACAAATRRARPQGRGDGARRVRVDLPRRRLLRRRRRHLRAVRHAFPRAGVRDCTRLHESARPPAVAGEGGEGGAGALEGASGARASSE